MGDVVSLPKAQTAAENLAKAAKDVIDGAGDDIDCLLLVVIHKSNQDIDVIVGPNDEKAIFLEHMVHKIIHKITDEDLGQY